MASELEKPRDVVGGLVVVAIGAGFLLFGRELEVGTLVPDGAGLFPDHPELADGGAGGGDGRAGLARAAPGGRVRRRCRGAALVLIVGRPLFFGLALRGLGLAPVLLVVVLATAWASRYASLKASTAAGAGHRPVLLGPVHQGAGPAPAADRALAEPPATGRRPRRRRRPPSPPPPPAPAQ